MEFPLLKDILVIFGLSILVIYIFYKVRIPSIIGFLFTGIITGPHGLGLIQNVHEVEILAEIGIILLLFTIGIEFSIKNLIKARRSVIVGGALQVGLVILFTFLIARVSGMPVNDSIFAGFLVSLSSTAIVMKLIQSRGDLGTFHGQTSLAILIFQDIIIVPMILLIPIMAGQTGDTGQSYFLVAAKGIGVIALMILGAKYIVPYILHQIARTQSNELFLLTIIVIGFATAWLTSSIGLSLALGAFIAGLVISESEFSEQAFGNIMPFRDLFTSFFFVSVGMLLNLSFVYENLLLVIMVAIGIILLKTIVTGFVAFVLGYPFRTTLLVGLSLAQVGEFSFVLSEYGIKYGMLSAFNNQVFLASAVISLSLTPLIIHSAPRLADYFLKFKMPEKLRCGLRNLPVKTDEHFHDHVIIAGYGIVGRNVARAAKIANIPHVIIELNPDTVKEEIAKGETIYYGDATQEIILEHANIKQAQVLVITVPSSADTRRITKTARAINPDLHIIIRTRFVRDMEPLYQLGANEVIPEEFETSVEIFARILAKYLIPHEEIEKLVHEIRVHQYEMFRKLSLPESQYSRLTVHAPIPEIHSVSLTEKSRLTGLTYGECSFIESNILLVGVSRGNYVITRFEDNFVFREGDILFFLGSSENFEHVAEHN
ncbi:MAG: cation:proton antiporter [Bacteroidales bacterium]|nr:cation:proton antiporter [Bacteroidales bacterium]